MAPTLGGGDETPAVTGDKFLAKWHNHSVDELFESVRVTMPADRPGTLSRQKNSDILAYIFAANRFPAGGGELSTQSEVLKQIKFETSATPGPQSQATPTGTAPAVAAHVLTTKTLRQHRRWWKASRSRGVRRKKATISRHFPSRPVRPITHQRPSRSRR